MSKLILDAQGLTKQFVSVSKPLTILNDVSMQVHRGEMVSIMGASGSGKSTLLHILALLDRPSAGEVFIQGQATTGLDEQARSLMRNQSLGFVYQFHHLLPEFSALDNVAMPLIMRRGSTKLARERAMDMLRAVGLEKRADHIPGKLSGGERQRVALARALVTQPVCVFADEPTGNLDRETASEVFELLTHLNQSYGVAFVLVTHDQQLAALGHRRLMMQLGQLQTL